MCILWQETSEKKSYIRVLEPDTIHHSHFYFLPFRVAGHQTWSWVCWWEPWFWGCSGTWRCWQGSVPHPGRLPSPLGPRVQGAIKLLKYIQNVTPFRHQVFLNVTCIAMRTSGSLRSSLSPGIPNGAPPGKPAPPERLENATWITRVFCKCGHVYNFPITTKNVPGNPGNPPCAPPPACCLDSCSYTHRHT